MLTRLLFLFSIVNVGNLHGQITGKLILKEDKITYQVSVISKETIEKPQNITNTGQITLKVKTGNFEVTDLQSQTGLWQFNTIIQSPVEARAYDYLIFSLSTHIPNPNYQTGIELPLFSFKNKLDCSESIELLENYTDEFWPPNSLDANIGNQLTILKFDINNAYEKNHTEKYKVDCPNILDFLISVDSIKCAGEEGLLKIVVQDAQLPFHYQLNKENGKEIRDSLLKLKDSVFINIPEGTHQFLGFDKFDTIQQILNLESPLPLSINILHQEKLSCTNPSGSISIEGQGGRSPESFLYNWSNGAEGTEITELLAGDYFVTLTDKNDCEVNRKITVEEYLVMNIDSVEMLMPTCKDVADGMIEMINITNGTPPFLYAINDNAFQEENFFENLVAGEYRLNVTDANNCVTEKRVKLENPPELVVSSISKDTFIHLGETIKLQPAITKNDDLTYNWTPITHLSCQNCLNPIAKPISTTTYQLQIIDQYGCESYYSYKINVLKKESVYVPNIFSPNADGINDLFDIKLGPTVSSVLELQIFNRWGQLIFHQKKGGNTTNLTWNGYFHEKPADSGTYIYVAKLQLVNGDTENIKGDFFLLK